MTTAATDPPIPVWQKVTAAVWLSAWVLFIVLDWQRFVADFWPPDRSSVGPNLFASLAQYTLLAITLILLWPPTRRRIHRFVDTKVDHIKDHVTSHFTAVHDRHDAHATELAEIKQLLHHVREHLDIPDLPPEP